MDALIPRPALTSVAGRSPYRYGISLLQSMDSGKQVKRQCTHFTIFIIDFQISVLTERRRPKAHFPECWQVERESLFLTNIFRGFFENARLRRPLFSELEGLICVKNWSRKEPSSSQLPSPIVISFTNSSKPPLNTEQYLAFSCSAPTGSEIQIHVDVQRI